jgi:hypothetical protein
MMASSPDLTKNPKSIAFTIGSHAKNFCLSVLKSLAISPALLSPIVGNDAFPGNALTVGLGRGTAHGVAVQERRHAEPGTDKPKYRTCQRQYCAFPEAPQLPAPP